MAEDTAKQELRIKYDCPLDRKLDDDLRETLKRHGFKWWASGVSLVDDVRDLAFERENAQPNPRNP